MKCRLLYALIATLIVLSLAGCGGKKNTINLGDGSKVELSGDEMTLKDNEGNEVTVGDKWPDSEWAKIIPEFTKGENTSSIDMAEGLVLTISEAKQDDFEAYLADIKEHFPDGDELKTEGLYSYSGTNENGEKVTILYYITDEAMMITVEKV